MEKKIRSELLKMTTIMVVLIGLGIYAHEFVISGIKAKAALNLSIFATFGLAAFLAFRHVFALKNEVLALKALQVDYGSRSQRPLNPYRHPAIVFQEPELLGQGYRMITEELGKSGSLHISNHTVQTLLHDVDQRINDRKSTIIYFSGLMVFLGLLGAFMGLMKTVHSVGDLIGGMDISGAGGSDSFGKLIEGMKGPLNGMSVGFSSSLFGLMTSMVLGAFERCMTSAMKTLRNEFEHWLSNLAALENPHEAQANGANVDFSGVIRALEFGGKQLRELREAVLGNTRNAGENQHAINQMAHSVTRLSQSVDKVTDPTPLLEPIARVVEDLAQNQTMMVSQFHGLFNMAERDRMAIRQMLEAMSAMTDRRAALDGAQLHAQMERMVALQAAMLEKEPVLLTSQTLLRGEKGGLFSRIFGGGGRSDGKKLCAEIRRTSINQGQIAKAVEKSLGESIERIEAGRKSDQDVLAQMISQNEGNQARLLALLDRLQATEAAQAVQSGDPLAATGLHGARLELDVLKRRLDLAEESEAERNARATPPALGETRATGTGAGQG
ncbi:hypothetical protein [Sphingobium phenoxybenzoativorans]|uniref:hypothetical protein n=1 Tax=Sphingobium phenoxybenzoativorans TaxID=1592790 RepID=UPI000871FBEB|nr:hypothetical protein [Sphingobium phenoxybenzoativorans]